MSVRFSKVLQTSTTTKMPTNAAVTWTEGFNIPAGTVEYLMLRGDCVFGADPVTSGSISALLSNIRIICNGEVLHDFRAGYEGTSAGLYGYFINSIGGSSEEVASGTTTREWYWAIPLGRTYKNTDVVRIETVVGWAAGAGAIVSGTLEWWVKYNDNTQTSTTVAPSTSHTHAVAIEQVIVKVPQNAPAGSVVSAILVQNDSAADELGSQGVRINALSDYGFEAQMIRFLNGDMNNGIKFADGAVNPTAQTFFSTLAGCELITCFGLAGGDISVQVDSTAVTTRTYTPILTSPVGTREAQQVRQTQAQPVNTAKAILSQGTQ
jgi:hypothetical protein